MTEPSKGVEMNERPEVKVQIRFPFYGEVPPILLSEYLDEMSGMAMAVFSMDVEPELVLVESVAIALN